MSAESSAIKTPLYALHRERGAKLVEFAGCQLPLSYAGGGLLAEHLHTRQAASLFDVSHMGQVTVANTADAAAALAALMPADLTAIAPGHAKYTMLTADDGGVIDDCIITNDNDERWLLVINAARKAADITRLQAALAARGAASALTVQEDAALLALQGPAAAEIIARLFPAAAVLTFMQSVETDSTWGRCRLTRCGYTGEDGFEISVAADAAAALADALLAEDPCRPAGLGARDSLRLEAGLCLYGSELREDISPIEAGLGWTIPRARRSEDSGYAGAAVICRQLTGGAPRRLTGLLPQGKTPVRPPAALRHDGAEVGAVTSGGYSPTLAAPVAMALIAAETPPDALLTAAVRGRDILCRQTALPFVPHRYHRG